MRIFVEKISSPSDLKKAFGIREKVFVEEQNVPSELEYDEFEDSSVHYLATMEGKPAGTARWRETGKGIKLERFAVHKEMRGKGVGDALVHRTLKDVALHGSSYIYMHAQSSVIPFYEKFGFVKKGEEFEEAGILHFEMYYSGK
ncbi:MAG: GNAT family N-acetyltransferase [Bacteroidota bacterium]|nr:GNAT family N-acetyltransferase [Bacteroidota bacterium]